MYGVYTITPFHNNFLFYKIIEGEIGFSIYRELDNDLFSPVQFESQFVSHFDREFLESQRKRKETLIYTTHLQDRFLNLEL